MSARSPSGTSCLSYTTPAPRTGNTKRQEIKDLLKTLEQTMPGLRERIFGAIQRYPLKGWAPDRTRTRSPRRSE